MVVNIWFFNRTGLMVLGWLLARLFSTNLGLLVYETGCK